MIFAGVSSLYHNLLSDDFSLHKKPEVVNRLVIQQNCYKYIKLRLLFTFLDYSTKWKRRNYKAYLLQEDKKYNAYFYIFWKMFSHAQHN